MARFGSVATDPTLRAQQSWDTNFRFGSHSFRIGTDEECRLRIDFDPFAASFGYDRYLRV
ncbi:MAG: hypothetical protein WCF81_21430 [Roseiarcus sp.]